MNSKSRKMMTKHGQVSNKEYLSHLHLKADAFRDKIEKIQQQKIEDTQSECTFKPIKYTKQSNKLIIINRGVLGGDFQ